MIIVCDTSPITSLIQIGKLGILNDVFDEIVIPRTVYNELCKVPGQQPILDLQNWILIEHANDTKQIKSLEKDLDAGEAEAIVLALELKADFLIIDEIKGRNKAEELGLKIVGTLGILLKAKQLGVITAVKPMIDDLILIAAFRIQPALYQRVLSIAGEK